MVFVDAKQILYQGNKLSPMIILTKNEEVFPVVVRDGKRTQEEINTMIGKAILVAKEADADLIVTGDKHLLDLKEYEGIGITRIAGFLYSFRT